jgi:hypothetical protein
MARQIIKNVTLDEKDGNKLQRLFYSDGSVEYLIASSGDDPNLRIDTKGETALKDILVHWRRIHSKIHNAWRNTHFAAIEAKDKEMRDREKDKQKDMFDPDSSE